MNRGLKLSAALYLAAIKSCTGNGDTGRALFLLREAAKRGTPVLPTDIADTMRTLTLSKQASGWKQALALYEGFLELALEEAKSASEANEQRFGVDDDVNSFHDATEDGIPGALLGQARHLHLLSEILPGWETVCQAALEACTSGGQWERALDILSVLRAGGELDCQVAYDEAIEVCGNGEAWDMVLLLVAELSSDEIPISPSTFETALKASLQLPCFQTTWEMSYGFRAPFTLRIRSTLRVQPFVGDRVRSLDRESERLDRQVHLGTGVLIF